VSLMTSKKTGRGATNGVRQRAIDTATQVVPMAKNAGMAARHSAEDAAAWAAPRVREARSWAAPRVEQAGLAVRDKIAPAISDKIAPTISSALLDAAHRIDDGSGPAEPRRRWPRVLGGFAMVAAIASAIAAVVMRRRPQASTFDAEGNATMPDRDADDGPAPAPGRADNGSSVDERMDPS
jgi:hypothetical protein